MRTRVLLALTVPFLLVGCVPSGTTYLQPAASEIGTSVLSGFHTLSTPRSAIPVGARWVPGIGPDGAGAPDHALRVSPSVGILESDANMRHEIEGRVYRWLGLNAEIQGSTKLELSDVEVVTVADISALEIEAGNMILYEAIRVGSMRMTGGADAVASAAAALRNRPEAASASVQSSGGNSLLVSGADLFLAYRIVEVQAPRIERTAQRIRGASRQRVGDYEFSFNINRLVACICTGGLGYQASHAQINSCISRTPITVFAENPNVGQIGRGGFQEQFEVRLTSDQRSTLMRSSASAEYIDADSFIMRGSISRGVLNGCIYTEGNEFDNGTQLEVIRARYPVRTIDRLRPTAGW